MAYASYCIILIHILTIINVIATSNGLQLNFSSILVFGDSTVDTGNNDYIPTLIKRNHIPYGKDFPNHVSTGRFSNGKLVIDFIASTINIKDSIPPFFDPNLSNEDLLTGVSFASAGSGFDDLTIAESHAISIFRQIESFKAYVVKIKNIVGEKEAKHRLENALVVISAGTNDFIINYYDTGLRSSQFTINQYQDFIQSRLQIIIEDLYKLGCRKFAVAGLPPIGCVPIQITTKFLYLKSRKCVEDENLEAIVYNQKLARRLLQLQAMLPGSRVVYASIYEPLIDLINQPQIYGKLFNFTLDQIFGVKKMQKELTFK